MDPIVTVIEILLVAFAATFLWIAWTEGRLARRRFRATDLASAMPDLGQLRRPLIPRTIRQTPLA